jgi:hypothetical protein
MGVPLSSLPPSILERKDRDVCKLIETSVLGCDNNGVLTVLSGRIELFEISSSRCVCIVSVRACVRACVCVCGINFSVTSSAGFYLCICLCVGGDVLSIVSIFSHSLCMYT